MSSRALKNSLDFAARAMVPSAPSSRTRTPGQFSYSKPCDDKCRRARFNSKLTALGKDERAISVSGYVHRELVKYTQCAFNKTVVYKTHSRNHLLEQVESFRVGDKGSDREDDLLDTFCYGIALALGNSEGF